jgi:hypothetical protein
VSDWSARSAASEERQGQAYSEEVFRYLLEIEVKRCARSNRRCLLLLIALPLAAIGRIRTDSELASHLFDRLAVSLRESDLLGWYRDGHIVGAVLTRPSATPFSEASAVLRRRVADLLCHVLPERTARSARVHVWELPRRFTNGTHL